jgi:putative flippase GtrA
MREEQYRRGNILWACAKNVMMNNRMTADKKRQNFAEFIRFCVVGAIATGIDAALFYAAKTIVPYQVALVIGYFVSLTVNYYLTTKWTFKVKQTWANLVGIISVHLVNLFVVRMGLMYLFVQQMGLDTNLAYVPMLIISVLFSFVAIKIIIHKA